MSCEFRMFRIRELWRFGGLVRRRRTWPSGYIQEMLNWRSYTLTWPGGDRLRFIDEVRDGRWRVVVIVAAVAVLVAIIILGR